MKELGSSLICTKSVSNNNYLFDLDNKFVRLLPDILVNKLADINNLKESDNNDYYTQKAIFLRENGIGNSNNKIFIYPSPYIIKHNLSNLNHIVFEVTDQCNLYCKYCGYGELYDNYDERKHGMLKFKEALPVLEYFLDIWNNNLNNSYNKPVIISSYGGEPMLNFSFIKSVVEYLKVDSKRKNFHFGMTTNALLLDKYMNFLVENKFQLLISLDGDERGHSYRVDRRGNNSFKKVISNVDYLFKKYPDYFIKYVNFNSVLSDRNSVESIHDFIKNRYNKIPNINEINGIGIKAERKKDYEKIFNNHNLSLKKAIHQKEIEKDRFLKVNISRSALVTVYTYTSFVFRTYKDLMSSQKNRDFLCMPTGTCSPFSKKIFITVKGEILPCERISRQYVLGKIKNNKIDLNFELIGKKYEEWLSRYSNLCSICFFKGRCERCVFHQNGTIKGNAECKGFIDQCGGTEQLSSIVSYFEENPCEYHRMMTEVIIT